MIISRKYAIKLIKSGKAKRDGIVTSNSLNYVIIIRYDLQRIDHYLFD